MDLLATLNLFLSVGGLLLLAFTVFLLVDLFFYKSAFFKKYCSSTAWSGVMFVTIGGVALSLVYSEYFGFVPCSLCWLQRIALYPQALLVLVAFRAKDERHFPLYGVVLSAFGLLFAINQYLYQMIPSESSAAGFVKPCLIDGTGDCAEKVINQFGFVTFPLISAIVFTFLIVWYLNMRRASV